MSDQVEAAVALEKRLGTMEHAIADCEAGVAASRGEVVALRADMTLAHDRMTRTLSELAAGQDKIVSHLAQLNGKTAKNGNEIAALFAWRDDHEVEVGPLIERVKPALEWAERHRAEQADGAIVKRWWRRLGAGVWKTGLAALGAATALLGFLAGAYRLAEYVR